MYSLVVTVSAVPMMVRWEATGGFEKRIGPYLSSNKIALVDVLSKHCVCIGVG